MFLLPGTGGSLSLSLSLSLQLTKMDALWAALITAVRRAMVASQPDLQVSEGIPHGYSMAS